MILQIEEKMTMISSLLLKVQGHSDFSLHITGQKIVSDPLVDEDGVISLMGMKEQTKETNTLK
jgi:hypothetical protein